MAPKRSAPKPPQPQPKGGSKPPVLSSSSEDKKPATAPSKRTWSMDDELRILKALAEHRREHGSLPGTDALAGILDIDNADFSRKELSTKVMNLRSLYNRASRRKEPPTKDRELRLFELSRAVWGGDKPASGGGGRELREMCALYPYLAEEVRAVEKDHPGRFKREFEMIGDGRARALDAKIRKHRLVQMELELRRYDLAEEVARTLMELVG